MVYSLDDLLNPFGKGVAAFNKTLIINAYEQRYYSIKDRIQFGLCKNGKIYLVHYRIPSESPLCKDVLYDVVLEFLPLDDGAEDSRTLEPYDVRIYTNSPSFTFTFTHAFNRYDLLIPWLKNRCISECLTKPAFEKNPNDIIGTDKCLWFAAYHLRRTGMHIKAHFEKFINTNYAHIEKIIIDQEKMLKLRARSEARSRREQQEAKKHSNAKAQATARFDTYRATKDIESKIIQHNARNPQKKINPRVAKTITSKVSRTAKSARSSRSARRSR